MAVTSRYSPFWSRMHLFIRIVGLTGLLALATGIALVLLLELSFSDAFTNLRQPETAINGVAVWSVVGGTAIALLWSMTELYVIFAFASMNRSGAGMQAMVQVVLGLLILVGVNIYSTMHYLRLDWTRNRDFTLSPELKQELRNLKDETTIVVYQMHKVSGKLNDKPDIHDTAAEQKIVERVKDLVEQFREFGPQFHVVELVIDREDFPKELAKLPTDLRAAINAAEESSIFVYAPTGDRETRYRVTSTSLEYMKTDGVPDEVLSRMKELRGEKFADQKSFLDRLNRLQLGDEPMNRHKDKILARAETTGRIQRVRFAELYQLDKTASRKANDGRGNLVLLSQGVEPFARKLLQFERKPRVAIAVNHEFLTTEGPDEYGLRGLRQALEANGFEVRDLILRKWGGQGPPDPTAYTYEQSRYASLESRLNNLKETIDELTDVVDSTDRLTTGIRAGNNPDLARWLASQDPRVQLNPAFMPEAVRGLTDQLQKLPPQVKARNQERALKDLDEEVSNLKEALKQYKDLYDKRKQERSQLDRETFEEQLRSTTDLQTKVKNNLSDCDLVIIPRMTILKLSPRMVIPNDRIHSWDREQAAALRELMKQGKPVLACFGPANTPGGFPTGGEGDDLEQALGTLGITFGKETVLHDAELEKLINAGADEMQISGNSGKIPGVTFVRLKAASLEENAKEVRPHPIGRSMEITSRSVDHRMDLEIPYPRPLRYEAPKATAKGDSRPKLFSLTEGKDLGKGSVDPSGSQSAMPEDEAKNTAKADSWVPTDEQRDQLLKVASLFVSPPPSQAVFAAPAPLLFAPEGVRGQGRSGRDELSVASEFLWTRAESWKDDQPFRVTPKSPWGPGKRGPIPIGVAVEAEIPATWYQDEYPIPKNRKVRVAAIGEGGWIVGATVSPAEERLLVDTCNWLLKRERDLPTEERPWSYPRSNLDQQTKRIWQVGVALGFPVFCMYLGTIVVFVRWMR